MAESLRAPKGVAEYVPPASAQFVAVRDALTRAPQLAGYGYLELPVFEDTALYIRGVGESTDVVGKEMYTFDDRGGRSLSLRPEGTAGVVRSAIENNLDRHGLPVKLWYTGPFFRAERPQQGRYRQFYQVGVEALGSEDAALDAEVIALAAEGFRELGLTQYRLLINSLGDADTRSEYRDVLKAFLKDADLDEDTRRRVELNPLRVLDDKRPHMRELLSGAPLLKNVLSRSARIHHEEVCEHLDDLGVAYEDAPRLVRGLDYYTRTTFEFVHDGLGAQSAIGGGGRYDGLMASLGGNDLTGIGYGLGIDRTLLACEAEGIDLKVKQRVQVFLVPMGGNAKKVLVVLAAQLRKRGICVDIAYGDRAMKGAMRAADRAGASIAVVVGERELEEGTAAIKNLAAGEQINVGWSDVLPQIQEMLS